MRLHGRPHRGVVEVVLVHRVYLVPTACWNVQTRKQHLEMVNQTDTAHAAWDMHAQRRVTTADWLLSPVMGTNGAATDIRGAILETHSTGVCRSSSSSDGDTRSCKSAHSTRRRRQRERRRRRAVDSAVGGVLAVRCMLHRVGPPVNGVWLQPVVDARPVQHQRPPRGQRQQRRAEDAAEAVAEATAVVAVADLESERRGARTVVFKRTRVGL